MPTEQGIVVGIQKGGRIAVVKAAQNTACKSCGAGDSCSSSGKKEMQIQALNPIGAQTGDSVVVSFETRALLKVTFILYIMPILALLAGAFWGQHLAPGLKWDSSTAAAVFGFGLFLLSIPIVRWIANRMADSGNYQPTLLRIVSPPGPQ